MPIWMMGLAALIGMDKGARMLMLKKANRKQQQKVQMEQVTQDFFGSSLNFSLILPKQSNTRSIKKR